MNSQFANRLRHNPQAQGPIMRFWQALGGVIRYEAARTLTPLRSVLWLSLMLLPVALVAAMLYLVQVRDPEYNHVVLSGLLYVLLSEVVTVLCMLLWAAPIVNEELESQTWIYILVRPGARLSLLLGKYLIAVLWTGTCTSISAVLAVVITTAAGIERSLEVGMAIVAVNWVSAMAHGALFMMIGTLFQRRAMVYAFAYAVAVEAILGWVPAVVNRFTISFRLRSLLIDWLDLDLEALIDDELPFVWEQDAVMHLSVMAVAVAVLLAVAVWRVERSQYRWQSEV
ncbi:MAG: hypothetical protein KF752_07915 [Pirellulaceae bacterium]|nr:hypothetical protein [Pirellulaceae bacterium]